MFVLTLLGNPAYNSTKSYLDHCLLEGKVCAEELTLSLPSAFSYIADIKQKDVSLLSLCSDQERDHFEQDYCRHLLHCCVHGKTEGIQQILSAEDNIDINQPLPCDNGLSITPLGLASLSASPSACNLLIKSGADVQGTGGTGLSPLHWAALANSPTAFEVLVMNGGHPEQKSSQGLIPLHFACYKGLPKVVTALLKHSHSIHDTRTSPDGTTPLIMAILRGHVDILKVLLKKAGPGSLLSPDKQGLTVIHHAAWTCNLKAMKVLAAISTWKEGLKLKDIWGRTPLIIAAAKGDHMLCQFLLKKGAKLSETDNEGRSLLHWAVFSGQLTCVNFFLASGSGAQMCGLQDRSGVLALHLAAAKRSSDILAALMEKGTGPVNENAGAAGSCLSPLVWAATCGWLEGVHQLLQANKMSLEGRRENPSTSFNALHAAASVGRVDICEMLITAGYEVDCLCDDSMTPLHYACRHGHGAAAKELLHHGAKVDICTKNEESGLHLAAMHGHTEVVQVLLEAGANSSRPLGQEQNCPTHLACIHGHSRVLQILLSSRVDPNQPRNSDGHTPIFIAAAHGHLDCCKVLMQHQADTATTMRATPEDLTPLDVAMKNGHSGCANYLISCRAPSGGGVYHRAALTIQAVWRYYRHKSRQRVAQEWAVMTLQRSTKAWLRRLRSHRVREARHAAYNRAALFIQHKWKEYIAQKRRYEDTYNRLKQRLQQERLAASLIVAELQAQAHKVSLPPSSHPLEGAAGVLMAGRMIHDKMQPGKQARPASTTKPLTLVARPQRPLKGSLPAIKLRNKKSLFTESSRNLSLPPDNTARDLFHSREAVSLPPLLDASSKPSKCGSFKAKQSPSSIPFSKNKAKLPPIADTEEREVIASNENSHRETECNVSESVTTAISTSIVRESETTSASETSVLMVSPNLVAPVSLSYFQSQRRTSTFKDTPLCYQPFSSKKIPQKITTLKVPTKEDHSSDNMNPNPLLEDDCRLPSRQSDDTGQNNDICEATETFQGSLKSDEDMNKVLNKVERYEKLMKVLNLLKQAKDLEENEHNGESADEAGEGLGAIKEHIKAALDEAIKLRVETDALCEQTS